MTYRQPMQPKMLRHGNTFYVEVFLCYSVADPFAVTLEGKGFDGVTTVWMFARELLRDGMNGFVGEGDVRIFPTTSPFFGIRQISVTLDNDGDRGEFIFARSDVVLFLQTADLACMPGTEGKNIVWEKLLEAQP